MSNAARLGIEPKLEASKAPVLPLDDLAMLLTRAAIRAKDARATKTDYHIP